MGSLSESLPLLRKDGNSVSSFYGSGVFYGWQLLVLSQVIRELRRFPKHGPLDEPFAEFEEVSTKPSRPPSKIKRWVRAVLGFVLREPDFCFILLYPTIATFDLIRHLHTDTHYLETHLANIPMLTLLPLLLTTYHIYTLADLLHLLSLPYPTDWPGFVNFKHFHPPPHSYGHTRRILSAITFHLSINAFLILMILEGRPLEDMKNFQFGFQIYIYLPLSNASWRGIVAGGVAVWLLSLEGAWEGWYWYFSALLGVNSGMHFAVRSRVVARYPAGPRIQRGLRIAIRLMGVGTGFVGAVAYLYRWEGLAWRTLFPHEKKEVRFGDMLDWRAPRTGFTVGEWDQIIPLALGVLAVLARAWQVVSSYLPKSVESNGSYSYEQVEFSEK